MTLFGFITLSILIVVAVGWILYNFGKMRLVSANGRNYPSKNYVYDYFGCRRLNESVMRVYGSEFRRYTIYNNDNIVIHRWGYLNDRVVEELEGYPVLVVDCFPEKVFCLCKYVGWCTDYDEQIPEWNTLYEKYAHRIKIERDKFVTQMRMDYSILSEGNNFFSTGDMAIVEMYDGDNLFYRLIPSWLIYGDVERVQDRNYKIPRN